MTGRPIVPRRSGALRLVLATTALAGAALVRESEALAGGFDLPDNGTQALGRGAAFVAKADDATAIYWNPAGLARQRGTHVLLNGNVLFHSFEFRRLGTFPDDPNDAATPWGEAPYPAVKSSAGPFFVPFASVTTDFGYFDRVTFGAGIYGEPTIGNRTFPLGVDDKPSASRYDFVQNRTSILHPTGSVGFRAAKWLDLGVSGHLVLASFTQTNVSYADIDPQTCKHPEYLPCDARSTASTSGTGFGATFGATIRPSASYAFAASFRTPVTLTTQGIIEPGERQPALADDFQAGAATYALQLPYLVKVGGRYIGMDADFEVYDLELDVTFEGWGTAQATGPILTAPDLGAFKRVEAVTQHAYQNTYGVRAGGAYNIDTGDGILGLRGGAYVDTAATTFANTRLDYDTLMKVAGTLGVGFKYGSIGFDVGYAAVASLPRLVGEGGGDIRPVNYLQGGQPLNAEGDRLPAVNEGAYRGFTHIVSLGITVAIDALFPGKPRPIHYGNTYEPNYAGPPDEDEKKADPEKKPEPEEKSEEKKSEEKKPEEKKPEPEKKPAEKKPAPKPTTDEGDDDEEEAPPPPPRKPEPKKPAPPPPPAPEEEKPPEGKKPAPTPSPSAPKPPTKRKEWWEEVE